MEIVGGVMYVMTMKTSVGTYKVFTKSFNDQQHFENWSDYLEEKFDWKLVGIDIKE
jgi:hypothetical protein